MDKAWFFSLLAVVFLGSCGEDKEVSESEKNEATQDVPLVSEARLAALEAYEQAKGGEKKDEEAALVELIEVLDDEEDYEACLARIEEYLSDRKFRRNKPKVKFLKGRALSGMGKADEAIDHLGTFISRNMGFVRCSTPAVRERTRLLWERNRPAEDGGMSDREEARKSLVYFLKKTEPIVPKFSDKEREDWLKLQESREDYQMGDE